VNALTMTIDRKWRGVRGGQYWRVYRGNHLIHRYRTKKEITTFLLAMEQLQDLLAKRPDLLASRPHPKIPNSNLTARDYAVWLLDNATSYSGVMRATKMIVLALADPPATVEGNIIHVDFARERPVS
jgi:hypothetical protein